MISPVANCSQRLSLLIASIALCAGAASLSAGEPIVFGAERVKAEPGKEKAPAQNPFRLEKLSTPSPFDMDSITPPILPQIRSNTKKDKRQQNAEDEKRNWMFYDKGDLQAQDDEKNFLGIRDDEIEDLDKTKEGHDLTFRDNASSKNPYQLRSPGQAPSRSPSQRRKAETTQRPVQHDDSDDDSRKKREPRSSAITFGRDERLDLKSLFEPKAERSADRSDFSLRGLLGSEEAPSSRERARIETFKGLLDTPSDPVNSHSDFTRQSVNPSAPAPSWDLPGHSSARSFGGDTFSPRSSSMSQPDNSLNYLGAPDVNSRLSGFGPAQAPGPWRSTPVEWPKSKF